MNIDGAEQASPSLSPASSTSKLKKSTTAENSMEVIAELIQEIQNTYDQGISSQVSVGLFPPLPATNRQASIQASLARRNKDGVTASTFLQPLRKFSHTLLSTGPTSIFPIKNDSKTNPIKSTAQVNELTSVGQLG
jgi:hypothetical protein